MSLTDQIGVVVGFTLTLMVVSYLFGDNFLFRLAVHVFIGVAAGYTAVMVIDQVIWQQTIQPLILAPLQNLQLALPLLLGGWLLVKGSPRVAGLGNPVLAILVGVGAATAIGGAVLGTLFPQVNAAMGSLDLSVGRQSGSDLLSWLPSALVMLLATLLTLAYFQFSLIGRPEQTSRFEAIMAPIRTLGQAVLAVTFGVLFAGVYLAALTAMLGRIYFVWETVWHWISIFVPMQ